MIPVEDLNQKGVDIVLATEDGSKGIRGTVSELLDIVIQRIPAEQLRGAIVSTCGPSGMLKAVVNKGRLHQMKIEVSLEARMACGVGACLGCTFFLPNGSGKRVCCDGPVFDSEEVFLR
jgi:dihydroorotate dehydrogenase electron transfer subunit